MASSSGQEVSPDDAAPGLMRAYPAKLPNHESYRFPARWAGLRARLMLFVTAVLLGPLGMIGLEFIQEFERAKKDAVNDIGKYVVGMAGRDFGIGPSIQQLLVAMSKYEAVHWYESRRCSQTFERVIVGNPRYTAIFAMKPDGTIFCGGNTAVPFGQNMAGREWFREAVTARAISSGHYVIGEIGGSPALVLAYPVEDDGYLRAVVAVGIDLAWLNQAVGALPAARKHAVNYVIDQDGLVLARSYEWDKAIGQHLADPRLHDALRDSTTVPFVATGLAGTERLFMLSPLEPLGAKSFYFMAGVDTASLAIEAGSRQVVLVAIFAFVAVFAYLVAWWGSELAIMVPVRRLLASASRFCGGDFSARVGPAYARNEIGALGRAFDEMAGSIGRHQTNFEAAEIRAQKRAREIEALFRTSPAAIVALDREAKVMWWNPAAEGIFGYTAAEAIDRPHPVVPQSESEHFRSHFDRALRGESLRDIRGTRQTKDGRKIEVEFSAAPLSDADGNVIGVVNVINDVTRRELTAGEIRYLSTAVEQSPTAIFITDAEGTIKYANTGFEKITGYTREEAIGQTPRILKSGLHSPEYYREYWNTIKAGKIWSGEFQNRHKDGRIYWTKGSISPIKAPDGKITDFVAIREDITEQRNVERQLRQSQKMEAIGQLTGGIAHDFNNLLGVMIGNLDLAREQVAGDPEALELVDAALNAGLRGAGLNKRLLAFARRQSLIPEIVAVNATLASMTELFKRSLGEHIEIHLECAADIWPVRVDPSQLESAIVNLAVNARDAMPEGGVLTLETRNVILDADYAARHAEANLGDYVMLAVSDTGAGMTSEVLARAFDPFFTTKPVGKGTGLGLSMVYGFLKQSGGHVNIYSEPNKGTTVRLYLPRATSAEAWKETPAAGESGARTGNELVLVVEDNSDMRRVAVRQIKEFGYRVAETENADRALALLDQGLKPDLMFVDVIMPGSMDGIAFAEEVADRHPGARILLTSGFTERATIESHKHNDKALPFHLLSKPYRKDELARAIRTALDNGK